MSKDFDQAGFLMNIFKTLFFHSLLFKGLDRKSVEIYFWYNVLKAFEYMLTFFVNVWTTGY